MLDLKIITEAFQFYNTFLRNISLISAGKQRHLLKQIICSRSQNTEIQTEHIFFLYAPINVFQSKKALSTHLSHEQGPLALTQIVKSTPLHPPFHARIHEKRFISPQTLIL